MMMYFNDALEENNCNQETQAEFMTLIGGYKEIVCVKVCDEGEALGSIAEVRSSKLFAGVIENLMENIKAMENESLKDYTNEEHHLYKDLLNRVSCILCNMTREDFGISVEKLESFDTDTCPEELRDIADCFFEMLEEINDDFDFETIDSAKRFFLILD